MRRADRLFQIIERLRRRGVVTARALADQLKVSERTIYRDVADLIASQVPIEGAAGIGYSLRKGYDLPPLMFTESELDALVFGARMVRTWSDTELGQAADAALAKI
jgi:predicted DNA-binding transcriptional regulator YafY